MDFGNFIPETLEEVYASSLKNSNTVFGMEECSSFELSGDQTTTEISGKGGDIVSILKSKKTLKFNAESPYYSLDVLSAIRGGEVKEVTDSNKYTLRKFDIVTLSADKTLTLEDTPATITVGEATTSDILEVALLNTDRTTKQVVTETATCAGKTVTLSSGTAGDLYRVVYNTEKTTGQVYLDEANSFSDTVSLYLKFLGHDACKTKDLTLYVKIPQFDFNGSFSMSGSDGKPATMKIDGSAIKSICGGNKVFAEWYVE